MNGIDRHGSGLGEISPWVLGEVPLPSTFAGNTKCCRMRQPSAFTRILTILSGAPEMAPLLCSPPFLMAST